MLESSQFLVLSHWLSWYFTTSLWIIQLNCNYLLVDCTHLTCLHCWEIHSMTDQLRWPLSVELLDKLQLGNLSSWKFYILFQAVPYDMIIHLTKLSVLKYRNFAYLILEAVVLYYSLYQVQCTCLNKHLWPFKASYSEFRNGNYLTLAIQTWQLVKWLPSLLFLGVCGSCKSEWFKLHLVQFNSCVPQRHMLVFFLCSFKLIVGQSDKCLSAVVCHCARPDIVP